tara:strand:- start:158 stop:355 length:198 start_codon:yes stop_codon:yes gene_type:complete
MNRIKKEFLEKSTDQEMLEIAQILENVERCGLAIEVIYTALKEMKSSPSSSPLLCLQIAAEDWDV